MAKAKQIAICILFIMLYYFLQTFVMGVVPMTDEGVYGATLQYADAFIAGDDAAMQQSLALVEELMMGFIASNARTLLGISALVSLLLFTLIYRARRVHFFSATKFAAPAAPRDIAFGAALGFGAQAVSALLVELLRRADFFSRQVGSYENLFDSLSSRADWPMFALSIGIILPVVEETLFRGMILRELGRAMPYGFAIAGSSLLFAVTHFNIVQFAYTLPLGLLLCVCFYKTQSLWTPIAVHVAMNMTAALLFTRQASSLLASSGGQLGYLAASLVAFAAALTYFVRREKAPEYPEKAMPARQ